jgi:hypothetical protein
VSSIHECIDCQALPVDDRPQKPRPAVRGGPRSKRCDTHYRAFKRAQRARNHARYVTTVYSLPSKEQAELWAFQGEKCPCGRQPTRMPDTDHDHACCPGPRSCGKCVRGMTCRACNREVLGRYNADQLRALAAYLEDPPLARLRRSRLNESEVA